MIGRKNKNKQTTTTIQPETTTRKSCVQTERNVVPDWQQPPKTIQLGQDGDKKPHCEKFEQSPLFSNVITALPAVRK